MIRKLNLYEVTINKGIVYYVLAESPAKVEEVILNLVGEYVPMEIVLLSTHEYVIIVP